METETTWGEMIGSHGEKRRTDVMATARHLVRLATREADEVFIDESKQAGGTQGGLDRTAGYPRRCVGRPPNREWRRSDPWTVARTRRGPNGHLPRWL